jgi:hypothetical protein
MPTWDDVGKRIVERMKIAVEARQLVLDVPRCTTRVAGHFARGRLPPSAIPRTSTVRSGPRG